MRRPFWSKTAWFSQALPELSMSAGFQPLPGTAYQVGSQEKIPLAPALRAAFCTAAKSALVNG
ncbi:hypothetical protein [Nonomuraea sp. JJY05]|uniref:hypothetical protein n=1 Tax=Nonomuraea sp. JJY05 TaxID=3350255 RepID=UPI00373E1646